MPTVPTVSGRQVESRGFQSPGFQAFEQPNVGDVISQVAPKAIDMFAQAKQRADVAQAQDASLQLSQVSSDLLTNPDTGLLNLQGKNALGKGQEYTQQFDSQAEQIAMTLPEGARAGFLQQAQQQRIQFTTQAGRHEINQLNAYEEGQFQATLENNGKLAASAYGDNANYVLYNQQTFQQIEAYGAAHGWSAEQIQAKKTEFKEKVADTALSQWSANNSIEFIQSNGELSDTVSGSKRATVNPYGGDPKTTKGMVTQGNINLFNRPSVKNEDGTINAAAKAAKKKADQKRGIVPVDSHPEPQDEDDGQEDTGDKDANTFSEDEAALRQQYEELFNKKPGNMNVETIKERIAEERQKLGV